MFELDPVKRRQIGTGMLMLGLVFVLISAMVFGAQYLRRQSVVSEQIASVQECDTRLRTLGAQEVTHVGDDTITTTWKGVDGGLARLGDASAAAMSCPGWTMQSFCMGQACSVQGVMMTLKKSA